MCRLIRACVVHKLRPFSSIAHHPGHSISYKIAIVPSKDSAKPVHIHSSIRVIAGHSVGSQGSKASLIDYEDPDLCKLSCLHWAHIQSCRKCCTSAKFYIQSTLIISTLFISNNCLSRSENLVPVSTWKSNNR